MQVEACSLEPKNSSSIEIICRSDLFLKHVHVPKLTYTHCSVFLICGIGIPGTIRISVPILQTVMKNQTDNIYKCLTQCLQHKHEHYHNNFPGTKVQVFSRIFYEILGNKLLPSNLGPSGYRGAKTWWPLPPFQMWGSNTERMGWGVKMIWSQSLDV